MLRRPLTLLPPLALLLAGCMDRELPTAAPEAPLFTQLPASPVVNSLADPGDGTCDDSECTLREAIAFASAGATITFGVTGTVTLAGEQLEITRNVSIQGPDASSLIVSGNGESRVFHIGPVAAVVLSGLTITGGHTWGERLDDPAAMGGGILNQGALRLSHATVSDNFAMVGGGILNEGTLTLIQTTISGNSGVEGGGIANRQGTLALEGSTVSGNSGGQGCGIYNEGTMTIVGGAVTHNGGGIGGGGIWNEGTLTLAHTTVSWNAVSVHGGGIVNRGTLDLIDSTVSDNRGLLADGGGIANRGRLTVSGSTISGNEAGWGAGIASSVSVGPTVSSTTIINSTISGNRLSGIGHGIGGGVLNDGSLTRILHSTISDNRATTGGGVWSRNDEFTRTEVRGSIVAGNTLVDGTTADDVAAGGSITRYQSLGYNLIGAAGESVDLSLEFDRPGDRTGVAAPGLGPLADNGGGTWTHALLAGSPAIDAGTCTDHEGSPVTEDQRFVGRPQGSGCDIGAFELEQASAPVFGGFLPPLREGQLNVVKAGRTVPIKFSLGGDFGLQIFAAGSPTSVPIACPDGSIARNTVTGTTGVRESRLTYDAEGDQYNYLWVSEKGWAGSCRRFELQLSDGSHFTLDFSFTR